VAIGLFVSDMHSWCASNECRCIQNPGLLYWCLWITKACGTWGLQYGKDNILGNSSILECGMHRKALLMNMTFPIMFCFVAKLLDITLSIYIGVFSGHEGLTTQLELFFLFLKKEKDNVGEVNFSKFRIDLRIFEKKVLY